MQYILNLTDIIITKIKNDMHNYGIDADTAIKANMQDIEQEIRRKIAYDASKNTI